MSYKFIKNIFSVTYTKAQNNYIQCFNTNEKNNIIYIRHCIYKSYYNQFTQYLLYEEYMNKSLFQLRS